MNIKNITKTVVAAAICAQMATGVFAADHASAAVRPISIEIDGQTLVVDQAPYIKNDTTLVPFRALFEALGMQVEWDQTSKTIVGRGKDTTIELTVSSRTAKVNNANIQLLMPPEIVGNRTFVPLRFISEAAGAQVQWDGALRNITVTTSSSSGQTHAAAAPYRAMIAVYNEYIRLANDGDANGVIRLFHEESPLLPLLKETLADTYAKRKVVTSVESITAEPSGPSQGLLAVTERHERTSGAFYMNNRSDMQIAMRLNKSGEWRLYDARTITQEWIMPYGWTPVETVTDQTVLAAVGQTMNGYVEALRQENLNEAVRWIDPSSPERAATETALRWMFETYDFSHELEQLKVLERSGDELYVYTKQTTRKLKGPRLADVRSQTIHTLRRQADGSWKLYSTSNGPIEELSLPQ